MGALQTLETKLDEVLGDKAPFKLPANARKTIVEYLPWINLVLGVLTLWTAWALWHWAHVANSLIDYVNTLSKTYGGAQLSAHRLTAAIWLGIIVLVVEGLLFVAAFNGTKDRKKSGWDLLFYASLVNVVYGVVIAFSDYGGVGRLITTLISSVIGLYFLFQIRSYYTGRQSASQTTKSD